MLIGEMFVRWTARIAAVAYLARVSIDGIAPRSSQAQQWNRVIWTVGCAIFLVHVAAAFHFYHGWNHAAALEYTRKQTLLQTGFDFGFGLYLNEFMTVWWVADAALWWRNPAWPENRWAYRSLHVFFAFMMFNATVVFGPRGWIPVLVLWLVWLIGFTRCGATWKWNPKAGLERIEERSVDE